MRKSGELQKPDATVNELLLDELIPIYADNKSKADTYKKLCDAQNSKIKELMTNLNQDVWESDGYKATCSVSTRETINEEMLLEILKTNGECEGIIKTKEYVDFDALESAIYKNLIPEDIILQMDKAKESKQVTTLRISKIKKKKEEDE